MVTSHHRIIILFLLVLGLVFTTHSVNASPSYLPGVKPGDWAYYGTISSSFQSNDAFVPPPDLLFAKNLNMTVQNTQGSVVTVQQIVSLTNQTNLKVRTLGGNLSSGFGNLDFWLIAGGLVKGDRVYRGTGPSSMIPAIVINETSPKVYAGTVRTVNIVNTTLTLPPAGIPSYYHLSLNLTAIFDQQTGILLELTQNSSSLYPISGGNSTHSTAKLHILITNTSLWNGSTTPGFMVLSNATDVIIGQNTNTVVQLTIFSLNHFHGIVTFTTHVTDQGPSAVVVPSSVTLPADGTAGAVLTIAGHNTPIGRFDFNVTGTANQLAANSVLGHVTVQLPDFSFQTPTSSVTILTTGGFVGDAFLKSIAGFSGTVTFSSTSTPSGLRAVFATQSIPVLTTGISPVGMSIEPSAGTVSAAPGNYVLSVSATSGTITHTSEISVNVLTEFPGFNITADPSSVDIAKGGMATSVITIHALDAYDPTAFLVGLDITVSPQGPQASIFPSFITLLTPIGSTTMTIAVPQSTPIGTYAVSVNATYNGHHHIATLTVNVKSQSVTSPDFVLNLDPVSRTITAGSSTTILVKAHGQNGFSDTLHFTAASTSQNGPALNFDPTSVSLSSSYPDGTVTLTVKASDSLSPGSYKIEIVGTSSAESHAVEATVNVQSSPGSQGTATNPSIFGIGMLVFYGIIGGVIAVAAVVGFAIYRMTRSRAIVP